MLCESEHGPPTDAGEAPGQEAGAPVEFLIAFVRNIIRENPSHDVYYLAMAAAKKECPITAEQEVAFAKAIAHERDQSFWPKGFF